MLNLTMFLNAPTPIDIIFFIVCGVIIAAIVGIYFLIPVFRKKQYQEQRDNLKKREAAFKSNLAAKADSAAEMTTEESATEEQKSE